MIETLSKMSSVGELESFMDLEAAFLSEHGYKRGSLVECGDLCYLCSC